MNKLKSAANLYIGAVSVAAATAMFLALARSGLPRVEDLPLAGAFAGLIVLAVLFPLHFAFKTKVTLDSSLIFAAVLLFEPGTAMLVGLVGTVLGDLINRNEADEVLFNSSQTVLQAGAGGLILAMVGWDHDQLLLNSPWQMAMVPVMAVIMYLIATGSVSVIIGLQSGYSPVTIWRQIAGWEGMELFSELALGVLTALVADVRVWALPLLILPAFAVYRSLERHLEMHRQTEEAVKALADIVDIRDPYTANHSRRVARYSRELATEIGLTPDEVHLVELAAHVHDIGKTVVDIAVLTKEGRLTDEEWEQLKAHPASGAKILSRFPQFSLATSYVRHHHERMDGKGYPDGLSGEDIPLGARIIAVADSFDAMSQARPYRCALSLDIVLAELRKQRGIQWDAQAVDALLAILERERQAVEATSGAETVRSLATA